MSQSIEELKKQRAELDKQIRAIKDVPYHTSNFSIVRLSKNKSVLKYKRFPDFSRANSVILFFVRDKEQDQQDRFMIAEIDEFIRQLQALREQIKK